MAETRRNSGKGADEGKIASATYAEPINPYPTLQPSATITQGPKPNISGCDPCEFDWLPDPAEYQKCFQYSGTTINEVLAVVFANIEEVISIVVNTLNQVYNDILQYFIEYITVVNNEYSSILEYVLQNIYNTVTEVQEYTAYITSDSHDTINNYPSLPPVAGKPDITPPSKPPENTCDSPNELEWLQMTDCGKLFQQDIMQQWGGAGLGWNDLNDVLSDTISGSPDLF